MSDHAISAPVLFLDVDGVLNRCGKSHQGIEDDKLALLRRIIIETECRIVLSSTWRLFERNLQRIKKEIELHDVTPDLSERTGAIYISKQRGDEIQAWLDTNPADCFCILDDDADMGELLPHLVKTDSFTGLTPDLACEVINRLSPTA